MQQLIKMFFKDNFRHQDNIFFGYPPNIPPHPGSSVQLSDAQCEENLAQLLSRKPERLQVITDFLEQQNLDCSAIFNPQELVNETFADIDHWLRTSMHATNEPQPPRQKYLESERNNKEIKFSLVADLALLEAEAVINRREDFSWQLNLEPDEADMPSYRRPCLLRSATSSWAATVFDMEMITLEMFYRIGKPGAEVHPFGQVASAVISGQHDES